MEVHLNTGNTFSVPATVADHLLKLASHDALKVLLYVLCHAGETLTADEIGKACNVQPSAIEEALIFWQNVNVLTNTPPQGITCHVQTQTAAPKPPVTAAAPEASGRAQKPAEQPAAAAPVRTHLTSSTFGLSPKDIAARMQDDPMIGDMLRLAEQCLHRPPKHAEMQSMIWMHEYLGLEPDIILMLLAYCVETKQADPRKLDYLASEWYENGITTHALAQEDIQRRTERRTYTGQIMRVFEMQRHPTAKQQAYIDGWQQLHMSPEMIRIAYEKTRNNTNDQLSFAYLDKIVQHWAEAGIFFAGGCSAGGSGFLCRKAAKGAVCKTQAGRIIRKSARKHTVQPVLH